MEQIPVEASDDVDTSESDPIWQTLLRDMVIDFESRTGLPLWIVYNWVN